MTATDVDLTGSHPCPVPGCRGSAEEHHRVNVGLVMENAELRRRLRENEVVDPLAERKAALLRQIEDFLNPRPDEAGPYPSSAIPSDGA